MLSPPNILNCVATHILPALAPVAAVAQANTLVLSTASHTLKKLLCSAEGCRQVTTAISLPSEEANQGVCIPVTIVISDLSHTVPVTGLAENQKSLR